MKILLMSNGRAFEVQQVGVFSPQMVQVDELNTGQVGFLTAGIKRVADSRVGETVTDAANPTAVALPGFREAKPMVFSGLYPVEDTEYQALRDALEKLRLNDSAFNFEPEASIALGFGFRCGFLGLLHMEIIQERLEREFGLALIATAPSVRYRIDTIQGEPIEIDNPAKLPPVGDVVTMSEPYVRGSIFVPTEFMGAIYKLAQEARGEHRSVEHIGKRVHLAFDFPLAEIIVDFYDRLKSLSRGYASFDYDFLEFRPSELVKLDPPQRRSVDALSLIVHRDKAYERGKMLAEKLKASSAPDVGGRHQAAIGSRVIACETVRPLRKNVTALRRRHHCKRKLLERQKEGKKRMKQIGRVEIPQEAFLTVLRS
jgi:GTP-binding protein LepA